MDKSPRAIVIYYSKHGTTKEYAELIAGQTGADLVPLAEAKRLDLSGYDAVAFGCPFYARRLKIAGFIRNRAPVLKGRRLAFFGVGADEPGGPDDRKVYESVIPAEIRDSMRFFFFRGRIVLAQLNFLERSIMKLMKARDVDFTDRAAIAPLVEFLKG